MSDAGSDASSDVSFDNISICDEIGQLIERCEELQDRIHNSFETLNNINELILNRQSYQNIMVSYNNHVVDFEEVLKEIHSKAIENIKELNSTSFGELILKELDNMVFL